MVATTTFTVRVTPTVQGWSVKVDGVSSASCRHLGEVEDVARQQIVYYTGMPLERILLKVRRP
jgi:hypothetical protein